jgi:hypothetical protein
MEPALIRTATALLAALLLVGCRGGGDAKSAPETTPTSSPNEAQRTHKPSPDSSGRVEGLVGAKNYPISVLLPKGFEEVAQGAGTRAFSVDETSGGILVQDLASLDNAIRIPADIAGYLDRRRDDLVIEDVGTARIDGVPAQSFTLRMKGGATPTDLWCPTGGTCFKPLPEKPMDVLVARTSSGVLWVAAEYLPKDRAEVRKQFSALVRTIRLG